MIKKADIILAAILIIIGLLGSVYLSFDKEAGSTLTIHVSGVEYGTYSLSQDQEIIVEQDRHINKITINNGYVSMTFSDCENQDCVKHSSISQNNETIVCLPNRVVLEIQGKESEYDAVAR